MNYWLFTLLRLGVFSALSLVNLPQGLADATNPSAINLPIVGGRYQYTVQPGDYLTRIGARYGVDAAVLASENALEDEDMIQPNQTLTIKNFHIVPVLRQNGLLVNLPQRMLYLFRDGKLKAAYPVGLGKPGWPTPMGDFTVLEKATDKPWVVPESIQEEMRQEGLTVKTQVPPGPDNPLGKYWLGLSIPALGIHGTIAPASIYQFQSHGCIRLHADRIAALYQHVAQGETGSIVYLPILLTTSEGKVFLEVHPDRYHRADISVAAVRRLAQTKKLSDHIDWARAVKIVKQHDGIATEVTRSVGAMD